MHIYMKFQCGIKDACDIKRLSTKIKLYKHLKAFHYHHNDVSLQCKDYAHSFSSEVTMVVNVPGLLLEVELNPVVEPDEMVLSTLAHKHMLKAA